MRGLRAGELRFAHEEEGMLAAPASYSYSYWTILVEERAAISARSGKPTSTRHKYSGDSIRVRGRGRVSVRRARRLVPMVIARPHRAPHAVLPGLDRTAGVLAF